MEAALQHGIPVTEISQQAAFLAVTRFVDKIWTSPTVDDCQRWLSQCLLEISWQHDTRSEQPAHTPAIASEAMGNEDAASLKSTALGEGGALTTGISVFLELFPENTMAFHR